MVNHLHLITLLDIADLVPLMKERYGIVLIKIPVPFYCKTAYEFFIKPIYEKSGDIDLIIAYEAHIYTGDLIINLDNRLIYGEYDFVYRDYKVNERWLKAREKNEN